MSSAASSNDWASESPSSQPESDKEGGNYRHAVNYADKVDYYAVLGLPRDPPPTDAQIRNAYRNLTLSFHPDKQPPSLREAAERQFTRIQEAYETLIDPRKRTVYDLLGAEGVSREWASGGSMGKAPAKCQELGARAQTPEEFRRWFIERMKRRERKMVNDLVDSRGSVTLGLDASSSLSSVVYGRNMRIQDVEISSYALAYSFNVPISIPRREFRAKSADDDDIDDLSSESEDQPSGQEDSLEMSINASIAGQVKHLWTQAEATLPDGEKQTLRIPLPLILATKDMTLGASAGYSFGSFSSMKGIFSTRLFPFLSDATVTASVLALPAPTLRTTFAKAYTILPGAKPIYVNLETTFKRSIFKTPPTVQLQLSKEVGERKFLWFSWNSGAITWPFMIEHLFRQLFYGELDVEKSLEIWNEYSQFSMGFQAEPPKRAGILEGDGDEDEKTDMLKPELEANAKEAWRVQVNAYSAGGQLACVYSRTIFSGEVANGMGRSEWSSEDHHPPSPSISDSSVLLEVQAAVSSDLSMAWTVSGIRRIGNFNRVGLEVGVDGQRGVVMAFSWSRLRQKIKLPIVVYPFNEEFSGDVAVLALVLSWGAYCAIEFGIIRPGHRKKRRLLIAKRRKELMKLVPRRKRESERAIEMMADQVHRRQAKEKSQGGLVITKADYGYTVSANKGSNASPNETKIADVTVPVAALVDHGQLVISKDMSKFQILGFYDPAPLLPKTLKIWYTFGGQDHFVEADDSQSVMCPMRSHRCS